MLELVVGQRAQDIVQLVENKRIRDKLEVDFSPKHKSNRPFSTTFDYIGAEFNTADCSNITRRPERHI